ncbi:hypothetical protein BUALT_Bualt19G0125700 [Buddleja alternifolia]|uniref:BZIP domain-containing protein n=1 Tax=Buddleja alternifolia TaxID=168488 RepID=A0AAV6W2F8_9LAMI|nr:hypothetical protein BUALT_Bualt19G0125700 [Buddleja alternifolia]
MDNNEFGFSNEQMLSCLAMPNNPSSFSFDIDKCLLRTQTCNDALGLTQAWTFTEVETPSDESTADSVEKKGQNRPFGNREAVRREKKKAKTSSLEDEVVRLRALNQQLMKKVQSQALLEAETCRLKCLLVDIRGRIEGEIGHFPYKSITDKSDITCNDQPGLETAALNGDCGFDNIQSLMRNEDLKIHDCELGNVSTGTAYIGCKRKGQG